MKLRKASESDSQRIIEFVNNQTHRGPIDYQIKRSDSFFAPYKLMTDDFSTVVMEDDQGEIQGVASLLFQEGELNGEKQILGYATDLTISQNRKAVLNWSKYFLPLIVEEREKRNCKYIFTVVSRAQKQAYNAFVRPRSPKRKLPRYHLFRKFKWVSLHGLRPFANRPLETIETRRATSDDRQALIHYICEKKNSLPLKYHWTPEGLTDFLFRRPDFKIEDFFISLDSQKNIVGCVCPFSPSKYQQIFATQFHGRALTLTQALKFFSYLGWTRPLASPFDFQALSTFHFDNPDIFYSLIYEAWLENSNTQFLSFCHFNGDFATRPPRSFFKSKIDCGLYCLLTPEDPIPEFLKLAQLGPPPDWEPLIF